MNVVYGIVRTAAVTLLCGYVGVIALLMFLENRLVYHPRTAQEDWAPPPSPEIEELELKSADGNVLGAWWLPCPASDRTMLYLHGNGGNLSHRGGSLLKMRKYLDTAVLIVDYPGYGKSTGSPSETGCYQAADAGYNYLTQDLKRDPKKLLIYGGSLGGAVAIELATRKEHHALIIDKSFTSTPDVGSDRFPWLPVHWFMRNRYPSRDRIRSIRTPVFISHGDTDEVIPFEHGEALFAAANEPKHFIRLRNHGHNEPLPEVFFVELRKFLDENANR